MKIIALLLVPAQPPALWVLSIVGFIALFTLIYSGKPPVFICRNWVVGWDRHQAVQHFVMILSLPRTPSPIHGIPVNYDGWAAGQLGLPSLGNVGRQTAEMFVRSVWSGVMRTRWFPALPYYYYRNSLAYLPLVIPAFNINLTCL